MTRSATTRPSQPRIACCSTVIHDVLDSAGQEIDRDTHRRIVAEIRLAMGKLEIVRTQHQTAINGITKAATAVNDLNDVVLRGLRQLDELMGA